jgi:hypothetical protein
MPPQQVQHLLDFVDALLDFCAHQELSNLLPPM